MEAERGEREREVKERTKRNIKKIIIIRIEKKNHTKEKSTKTKQKIQI